ncbi:MAG TPA: histidine--tRNA ligase [Dehalococcoidales bacterium]|nr:histidine--tRNA ligase [Dehalococcoidales bacterium]
MYRAPRGTTDILPEQQAYWRYVEQKAARICRLYGYERIDLPMFEDTGLFTRGVGEGTDIVEKEMYVFEDRGGNSLALRPEGTASVCRAYLEHGLHNRPQPVKLFYIGPAFRYERPQAGRYRQHNQFGCEAIGDADPALDAEVIDMAWQFFFSLGLGRFTVVINSIGCRKCRTEYLSALKEHYHPHIDEVCPDCHVRFQKNPLRLLDCKNPLCQPIADGAPKSADYLCSECTGHYDEMKRHLGVLEIPFKEDRRLVRGFDYYTRTVFEVQPEAGGSQSSLGGGGRYDGLLEELGGKPTPGVGFATGIERMVLGLTRENIPVPPIPGPEIFIAHLGNEARDAAMKLATTLRRKGAAVLISTGGRSLKAQLRQANNLGIPRVAIIGEDEVRTGTVMLRDMTTSRQESVPVEKLLELVA